MLPPRPRPALKLELGPDHVVGCAGVDPDSRQRCRQCEVLQGFRLLDDVVAREIVTALPEYLLQHHPLLAGEIARIRNVGAGQVFIEKGAIRLNALITLPVLVLRVLVRGTSVAPPKLPANERPEPEPLPECFRRQSSSRLGCWSSPRQGRPVSPLFVQDTGPRCHRCPRHSRQPRSGTS